MSFFIEFVGGIIAEIVFEGALGAAMEKRVPLWVRILLAFVLLAAYLGLVGLFLYFGIKNKSGFLVALGVFVLVLIGAAVYKTYRKNLK